ncbi:MULTISPECIES: putative basic amino acid antiporter YfcC [Rheinheimera]|uniref:Basic amino acid antiporter YfcC n=1 Tax=Rheinheimera marina TaxID=1774958 RepID=A0ABV9JPG9_9GAMM
MQNPEVPQSQQGWQMPDTLLIVFGVLLLSALLAWWLPPGVYQTALDTVTGRQLILADSFRLVPEAAQLSLFADGERTGILTAFYDGMTSGSRHSSAIAVVVFILMVGGSFGLMLHTGAVEQSLRWLISKLQHRAMLLLPVLATLFSLGGAVFGMGEEAMAFAILLVPLIRMLGYDAMTAVLLTYGASQIGFATSWMNPFSVAIAQSIAQLPPLSGTSFRLGMWLVFTGVYVLWMVWRAERYRQHSTVQSSFQLDHQFSLGHGLVVLTLLLGLVWVVWGVVTQGYYLREIATQFFVMGLVSALIGLSFGLNRSGGLNAYVDAFKQGAAQLLPAALVVGIAQGIILLLGGTDPTKPTVINTLLHHASGLIDGQPEWLAAQAMLVFQSGFNFFVTSGSGQAALTMPLMAPLADLVGVSRQTAVLAFQLGDGLAHLFYPTSAALMGTLAIARVEFVDWLKNMWSLCLLLTAMSMATVALAVQIGF